MSAASLPCADPLFARLSPLDKQALADVKVARQGGFRSAQGGAGESGSAAVRCVLRSDDGHLFCLNKVFFFLPKPPTLIRFDEVEQVEFERQSGKAAATKSFDLAIHVRNPVTQAVAIIRFTNIAQQEFNPLVQFFGERGIKVGSLAQDDRKQNPFDGLSDDEEDDYVAQRMREQGIDPNDSDEEDEDFKARTGGRTVGENERERERRASYACLRVLSAVCVLRGASFLSCDARARLSKDPAP